MNSEFRRKLLAEISGNTTTRAVFSSIDVTPEGLGTITYDPATVWVDPSAPGFNGTTTAITDEEVVRAHLLSRLVNTYAYPAEPSCIEVEKVYKPVGRPTGKGGRVDAIVRKPSGEPFLFIECKAPDKFDCDLKYIDGQLFRLSKQEAIRPTHLVYYTVDLKGGDLRERIILIDTDTFPDFDSWDNAGQPITDAIPSKYGLAVKRRYANIGDADDERYRPLDRESGAETFHRLRNEVHDVIWGGGGTNNNEVFSLITKLILCKIFDEKETAPGDQYRFQRLGDAIAPEPAPHLADRLNLLYKEAEASYLALPTPSGSPAFDVSRITPEKIAYVVGRLEGISITNNKHPGDLLGEFFEQIVSQDFTQTKGQFFTPLKLVKFMLHLSGASAQAHEVMLHHRDHLGRPRLPYVIDPSCGSGTFLIEYMKLIRNQIGASAVVSRLPARVHEMHAQWFSLLNGNAWAREFLFGIESNYDLGLSAKVNMVLHGDGSMNTWIKSGLRPFGDYWVDGRTNILGSSKELADYSAPVNEQFDLVLSNPPFSIRLSADEKSKVEKAFDVMASASSEAVFIERWYQLLREGGSCCCVLPEAILDTSTHASMRLFLIASFRIRAIVSLPYDSFRPFTSTKTCVLFATKRTAEETRAFKTEVESIGSGPAISPSELRKILDKVGWADAPIFMAEPATIGYKRRKNLPDLPLPNELYRETASGDLAEIRTDSPTTVLDHFTAGSATPANDSTLGFWTNLRNVSVRKGFRLDPKYRWLWDFQGGAAHGDGSASISDFLKIVDLRKAPKGDLTEERPLVDLEYVESRQAIVRDDVPTVDVIGSDKIYFEGCDLVISKLEPYLGKVIMEPDPGWLGSTEWVGLTVITDIPLEVVAYLLMAPSLCDAYRRLQSGKRHARFDPREFLNLRVQLPAEGAYEALRGEIISRRTAMLDKRRQEKEIRLSIDQLFASTAIHKKTRLAEL